MVKIRRTQFLIKRSLQLKFALLAFLFISLSTIGVWFMMDMVVNHVINSGWNVRIFLSRSTTIIWAFIVADAIAVCFLTVVFSHYVIGPIYRMEQTLLSLLAGEKITAVALRKKDSLQDTAEILNQVIERWNEMSKENESLKRRR